MPIHYHVAEYTPGYLPDSDDPTYFERRRDADRDAVSRVRSARSAEDDLPRRERRVWTKQFTDDLVDLTVNERASLDRGSTLTMAHWYGVRSEPSHDLGRSVTVEACGRPECKDEFERWAR